MNSVFSFISGFMACFRERVRDRLIVISIFCLILLVFIHGSELVSARFLYYVIMGCGLLGVIILCSVRGEQRQQPRISKGFFAVWMLYGLLQIVSGIVNGYEYLPDGVLILIAFPVLYLAWNDRGFEAVFPLVLKGLRYSMYLMLAVSFLFFPLKGVQYTGLFSNQNALADYLTVVFCGLFIELLGKKSLKSSMGLLVLAGVAFALIYYSGSRTGMLATLLGTVFVAGMEIARERRHCGLLLKKCVGLLLSAFVFSNVLIYVFMLRAILPLPDFADIIRWLGIDTTRIPRIAA